MWCPRNSFDQKRIMTDRRGFASTAVRALPYASLAVHHRLPVFAAGSALAARVGGETLALSVYADHSVSEGSVNYQEERPSLMTNADRILRLPTVLARTGLSRSTLYRKISEGTFPRQIQISIHGAGWYESEINTWIADPMRYGREQKAG